MRVRHSAEQRIADWEAETDELRDNLPPPWASPWRRFADVDPVALREQLVAEGAQLVGARKVPLIELPQRFP